MEVITPLPHSSFLETIKNSESLGPTVSSVIEFPTTEDNRPFLPRPPIVYPLIHEVGFSSYVVKVCVESE